ncbi:TIM barrel protein [Chitinophaga horti]|uniref:TIM barrel protein n=1 Tax=Chitinophaga horti TaxID=2920382 RepID=A0ABY6IVE9_9BACT|nr:TIM barrel protein [Chitinophaga horti]UYQ91198.1 TIM barrel protein [Chitinophaga horti]
MTTISRRSFLATAGVAASALLLPSFASAGSGKRAKKVGIQLWSLRDVLPGNVKGTIADVAKAGFSQVETFGYSIQDKYWGLSPKELKATLSANGLTAPSGHYGLGSFLFDGKTEEVKSAIEAANILGSEYITVPYLVDSLRSNADDYKKIAEKINIAAELAAKSGLRVAYHNHDFEFQKHGDVTGYDILLKDTDRKLVDFELDLYWVVRAGHDPIQMFKDHPGRFTMWHVKDMDKANPDFNAVIGQGKIDFKTIFKSAKLSGMKHFFVEHESNYIPNPLESVRQSCAYIKKNLI